MTPCDRWTGRNHWPISVVIFGCFLAAHLCVPTVLADENVTAPSVRTPEDDAANQAAQDVFSSDEYWWKRTSSVKSSSAIGQFFGWIYENLIHPIIKAFLDLIEWVINRLFSAVRFPQGDWSRGIPFLWTLVILLVLFVAWRLFVVFRRGAAPRPGNTVQVAVDVLPQADVLLEQARNALAAGDRRSAIRLALLSLLTWLQDRGQLKYDPSRSNREYQRDLRRWPEMAASFRAVAEPFENCWYGGRDLNAVQIENAIAICRDHFRNAKGIE